MYVETVDDVPHSFMLFRHILCASNFQFQFSNGPYTSREFSLHIQDFPPFIFEKKGYSLIPTFIKLLDNVNKKAFFLILGFIKRIAISPR